jgi:FAD synthase
MMSIGTNPTVTDDNKLSIEVYYLDFEGDLYGKNLQVSFLAYIRDEQNSKTSTRSNVKSNSTEIGLTISLLII